MRYCFSRLLFNNLFFIFLIPRWIWTKRGKTAVEAIKIEDTYCSESICLIFLKR